MKQMIIRLVLCGLFAVVAPLKCPAFVSQLPVLNKTDIAKLNDAQLMDVYIDVLVEIEASKTFHETAGFTNIKEYSSFKELIKYRILLLMEIYNRNLELPQFAK